MSATRAAANSGGAIRLDTSVIGRAASVGAMGVGAATLLTVGAAKLRGHGYTGGTSLGLAIGGAVAGAAVGATIAVGIAAMHDQRPGAARMGIMTGVMGGISGAALLPLLSAAFKPSLLGNAGLIKLAHIGATGAAIGLSAGFVLGLFIGGTQWSDDPEPSLPKKQTGGAR